MDIEKEKDLAKLEDELSQVHLEIAPLVKEAKRKAIADFKSGFSDYFKSKGLEVNENQGYLDAIADNKVLIRVLMPDVGDDYIGLLTSFELHTSKKKIQISSTVGNSPIIVVKTYFTERTIDSFIEERKKEIEEAVENRDEKWTNPVIKYSVFKIDGQRTRRPEEYTDIKDLFENIIQLI